MKTEARYAIDGKTHYSVMKEIPVPKELKGFVTKSFIKTTPLIPVSRANALLFIL